jgi:hypothetical protein
MALRHVVSTPELWSDTLYKLVRNMTNQLAPFLRHSPFFPNLYESREWPYEYVMHQGLGFAWRALVVSGKCATVT